MVYKALKFLFILSSYRLTLVHNAINNHFVVINFINSIYMDIQVHFYTILRQLNINLKVSCYIDLSVDIIQALLTSRRKSLYFCQKIWFAYFTIFRSFKSFWTEQDQIRNKYTVCVCVYVNRPLTFRRRFLKTGPVSQIWKSFHGTQNVEKWKKSCPRYSLQFWINQIKNSQTILKILVEKDTD